MVVNTKLRMSFSFTGNPFGVNGVWKLHCIQCGLLSSHGLIHQEAA